MEGISCYGILVYLDCAKYNEINTKFCHAEKYKANRILHRYDSFLVYKVEVCTGRIFQTGPGTARMATISARPKIKKKNSARARPERKIEI